MQRYLAKGPRRPSQAKGGGEQTGRNRRELLPSAGLRGHPSLSRADGRTVAGPAGPAPAGQAAAPGAGRGERRGRGSPRPAVGGRRREGSSGHPAELIPAVLRHPRLSSGQLTPSSLTPIIFPNLIRQISRYGAAGDWSMLMTRLQRVTLLVNIYCFLFFFSPPPIPFFPSGLWHGGSAPAGRGSAAGPGHSGWRGRARLGSARLGTASPPARQSCPTLRCPPPCPRSRYPQREAEGKGVREWAMGTRAVPWSSRSSRGVSFLSGGQAPGPRLGGGAGGAGAAGRSLPSGIPHCRAPALPGFGLRAAELRHRPPSEEITPESVALAAPEQWGARLQGG